MSAATVDGESGGAPVTALTGDQSRLRAQTRGGVLPGLVAASFLAAAGYGTPTAAAASPSTTGGGRVEAATAHIHYAVFDRISGPDGNWDYSTVDPSVNRLFLARHGGVMAMDIATHIVIPLAVKGQDVHIAEPVGDTGLVLVTNGDTDTVTVFEAKTDRILGRIKVGKGPDAAVYDPSTKLVAVINHDGGTVSLVDASTASVVRTVVVGGELEFAAPSGDGKLFLNVASRHEVAVIDLNAGTVLRRYMLSGCEDPSGLVFDSADNLIASVCRNGVTKFLRATDGEPIATLHTGVGSDGLIFDARRKLLFVPAARQERLSVVQLGSGAPKIIQRLKTGPAARSGALDPRTGLLYFPSARLGPARPPAPWPTVVPGTFRILVIENR